MAEDDDRQALRIGNVAESGAGSEEHDMSNRDDDGLTGGSAPATVTDPSAIVGKRRRGVRVTYAAAIALGLAIGGGAMAGAATGSNSSTTPPANHADGPGGHPGFGRTPPAAFGKVASVGSDTFTVTGHDGTTVTVIVTGTTTYLDPGVTTPTLADVTVGAHVAVFGTDTNNTVTATQVGIGPDGSGGPGMGDGRWAPPSSSRGTPSESATTSGAPASGSTLA
jgi:hypothetical protein